MGDADGDGIAIQANCLTLNGSAASAGASVSVDGRTVTITLAGTFTIESGDTVTIAPLAGMARDRVGNQNDTEDETSVSNTVGTPPRVASAQTSRSGRNVTLVYYRDLKDTKRRRRTAERVHGACRRQQGGTERHRGD